MSNACYSECTKHELIAHVAKKFGILLDTEQNIGGVVGRGLLDYWDPYENARDLKELLLRSTAVCTRIGEDTVYINDTCIRLDGDYQEVLIRLLHDDVIADSAPVFSHKLGMRVSVDWRSAYYHGVMVNGNGTYVWIDDWYSDLFKTDISNCIGQKYAYYVYDSKDVTNGKAVHSYDADYKAPDGLCVTRLQFAEELAGLPPIENAWRNGEMAHVIGYGLGTVKKVLRGGYIAARVDRAINERATRYIIEIPNGCIMHHPAGILSNKILEVDETGREHLIKNADGYVVVSENPIAYPDFTQHENAFQIFYNEGALFSCMITGKK